MVNSRDILETINMIDNEHLDVRTITMGISLLDCIDSNIQTACTKVYDKICRYAKDLVKTGEDISKEYGIPIINKRIAVSPIAMLAGACNGKSPIYFAHALDKAAKEVGVNFIGGYSALVHKGFSAGDYALISSIPQALAETDFVCSSVNIGSTKAGINMDAVAKMGKVVRKAAELTADRDCIGAAKLVVFCNAPEDNPFMAGAFHGVGEPDFDPEFNENSEVVSRNLAAEYRKVALQNHAAFLNAADYALPSITDREHLDEKGHAALADAIYDKIIALQKGLSNVI